MFCDVCTTFVALLRFRIPRNSIIAYSPTNMERRPALQFNVQALLRGTAQQHGEQKFIPKYKCVGNGMMNGKSELSDHCLSMYTKYQQPTSIVLKHPNIGRKGIQNLFVYEPYTDAKECDLRKAGTWDIRNISLSLTLGCLLGYGVLLWHLF